MIAFLAAVLALAGLLFGATPRPAAAAPDGLASAHICGAAQPGQGPQKDKACAACPLCVATVLHATVVPPAASLPAPAIHALPRAAIAISAAPATARPSALRARGPPTLS